MGSGLLDGVVLVALAAIGALILVRVIPLSNEFHPLGLGWGMISVGVLVFLMDGTTAAYRIFSIAKREPQRVRDSIEVLVPKGTAPNKLELRQEDAPFLTLVESTDEKITEILKETVQPAAVAKSDAPVVPFPSLTTPAPLPPQPCPLRSPKPKYPIPPLLLDQSDLSMYVRQQKEIFYRNQIKIVSTKTCPDYDPGTSLISTHKILGYLHLGNLETIIGESPNDFDSIITVCTLYDVQLYKRGFTYADIQQVLGKTKWFHVGKSIGYEQLFWWHLVHDCTFPNSQLAIDEVPVEEIRASPDRYRAKKDILARTPVVEWFEEIFKVMDSAVFDNKKVLVHCIAGESGSASIIMAYLMNRFHVTCEEAYYFVLSGRPCIDPIFWGQLKEYEMILATAHAQATETASYCHSFPSEKRESIFKA